MADINKHQVKMMQSQRLDDTDQGGGQMTSHEVVNGEVNNLFPDISRLDRVYGRVSMRKGYLAVQTGGRETYYGSHTVLVQQAEDPNVSVCFFSSKDWFDMRKNAQDRVEAYLVKGPFYPAALWGDHYTGSRSLMMHTYQDGEVPEVGDVMVLEAGEHSQYVRVTDVDSEVRSFDHSQQQRVYYKKIITISIGNSLIADFPGEDIFPESTYTSLGTTISTTVAADASRYYGVANLAESVNAGSLTIRVDNINTPLVPSAQSETAVIDAGIASPNVALVRSGSNLSRTMTVNFGKEFELGMGLDRGTLSFSINGDGPYTDDKTGILKDKSGSEVGYIDYAQGVVTFDNAPMSGNGSVAIGYHPTSSPKQVSETASRYIDINNRGFVYTFRCNPTPVPGTLKVSYLSGGKWYSISDTGNGNLRGLHASIGTGVLNFETSSVAVSLGAMPDVDSSIILSWAKQVYYKDISGETAPMKYNFFLNNNAVARGSVRITYSVDASDYGIVDDGNGRLTVGSWDGNSWDDTGTVVGWIRYATGEVEFAPHSTQALPTPSTVFNFLYNYGDPIVQDIFAPPRDQDGNIYFTLDQTPIVEGSLIVEWHTLVSEYEPETRRIPTRVPRDPVYIENDDMSGNVAGGTVNYATGDVEFNPDREVVFPFPKYAWENDPQAIPGQGFRQMRAVFDEIEYLPTMSVFPTEGEAKATYYSEDGTNLADYSSTLSQTFVIHSSNNLPVVPGSYVANIKGQQVSDDQQGRLRFTTDGKNFTDVGSIDYIAHTVTIEHDEYAVRQLTTSHATGTADIDPAQYIAFRTPGAPIRPGSLTVRATAGDGTLMEASSDFSGDITGDGVHGHVDFSTGSAYVCFGKWVLDEPSVQGQSWYADALKENGNVFQPIYVDANTLALNCVIVSNLPLDAELLGLDPVRLPVDGKVPIFRDGYILLVHESETSILPDPIVADTPYDIGFTNVDMIEVYDSPDPPEDGELESSDFPKYVQEVEVVDSTPVPNFTYDLSAGTITFTTDFLAKVGNYRQPFRVLSRIEDMVLASDVQVTGHIGLTRALTHSYTAGKAKVSSVLPSSDLQSRAYNEYVDGSWSADWERISPVAPPLANFNFVDYPITVFNAPSIKENWLILFKTSTTVDVIGENFGVLATNVDITSTTSAAWVHGHSGVFMHEGKRVLIISNNQFTAQQSGFDGWYWKMETDGFGSGWNAGNCIRFNQDAANFPLWFVRTTLQAPPTEPVDNYIIQVRGDSS